jgi:hypothetical protein
LWSHSSTLFGRQRRLWRQRQGPKLEGFAANETISHAYDPAGALRSATSGTLTTTLEYNEAGRASKGIDSFGALLTVAYDSEGNAISRVATPLAGGASYASSYTYDARGSWGWG